MISSLIRRQPHPLCSRCIPNSPPESCYLCDRFHQEYPFPEELAPMGEEIWLKIAEDKEDLRRRWYTTLPDVREFCKKFGYEYIFRGR